MALIRLNKYLANIGIAARRKIDIMIDEEMILVDGKLPEKGQKINPEKNEIKINGKTIRSEKKKKEYYILNKPKKVLCASKDKSGRKLVTEFIETKSRIYPIGRLDYETTGLIILTNDGDIVNNLIHPRKEIYKTYIVTLKGALDKNKTNNLKEGILIEGKKTLPSKIKKISRKDDKHTIQISIREGRNRQIRKMIENIDCRVIDLKRISIGDIDLGDLKIGEYRKLTTKELGYIKSLGGN